MRLKTRDSAGLTDLQRHVVAHKEYHIAAAFSICISHRRPHRQYREVTAAGH